MNEAPQLAALYQHYRPHGLQAVAVAMSYDRAGSLNRFMQTRQPPYPVAHDRDGSLARQWGDVRATPTAFVLDRKGRIARRFVGSQLHEVSRLIGKLLSEG